jgi:hypothetical protein
MPEGRYLGPFFKKEIKGIKIWNMIWIPDLKWQLGQEIPKSDPEGHPHISCVGVGIEYKCFNNVELPGIISMLKEANSDVLLGKVTVPKDACKEIANELNVRSKLPL